MNFYQKNKNQEKYILYKNKFDKNEKLIQIFKDSINNYYLILANEK